MKKFEIIFLDVDDTLLNFIPSWVEHEGLTMEEVLPWWRPGEYWGGYIAISEAKLEKQKRGNFDPSQRKPLRIIEQEVKLKLRILMEKQGFWLMLKPEAWFKELIQLCLDHCEHLELVTSPSTGGIGARIGKMEWFDRYYPQFLPHLHITENKHLFARGGRLLIDDADHNVSRFKQYNGEALVFPRHHNKGYRERDTPMKGLISAWEKL